MAFNTFPCNPYPISTEELNKGNNDDLNARVATLEGDVSDLNSNKANQITIAPFFNAETAYTVGDLVYYNGLTYRCTNDHEGEWDADDFAATTISNELDSLKSGLTNKVLGTISGTNVPCNVESTVHYTDDNTYNVWTTHTFTFGDMTSIAGAYLQAVNPALISDGIKHEAELLSIVGNVVTYAVKGAWSGGAAGVNVMIVAFGV